MLSGIIVIDKEPGFTSHDVVAKMRGICGQRKIGHTGTLDPMATGVLPVCLGNATKLCDLLTEKDKEYEAQLLLGVTTDTQDVTGRELSRREVSLNEEQVREAVYSFQGEYSQIPPMYSAIKVNGKRLYQLARQGKEVERPARRVTIGKIEILDVSLPLVTIRVLCSKGTYIRTLCADIGEKLGCGGIMKSLNRTRSGSFFLKDAVTLSKLEALRDQNRLEEVLIPPDQVFASNPLLHVLEAYQSLVENGNPVYVEQTREKKAFGPGEWVRIYRSDESFAGIYAYDEQRRQYRPVKMFL